MKRRPTTPAADEPTVRRSAVSARRKPPARPVWPPSDVAAADYFLSLLRAGADTRTDKVDRLRQSVEAWTYENDLKLSIAIDRLTFDVPST